MPKKSKQKNVDSNEILEISALDFLLADDADLLNQCEIHIYKASGPGGQHRNKVSSAIRLHHKATGITATANDSRSQHDNKKRAITRMRMNLAVRLRKPIDLENFELPEVMKDYIFIPKKTASQSSHKLQIGRKDKKFWTIAAVLLDMLAGAQGKLGDVAKTLQISTGNLTKVFKIDRHLIEAVQNIRKKNSLKPIN